MKTFGKYIFINFIHLFACVVMVCGRTHAIVCCEGVRSFLLPGESQDSASGCQEKALPGEHLTTEWLPAMKMCSRYYIILFIIVKGVCVHVPHCKSGGQQHLVELVLSFSFPCTWFLGTKLRLPDLHSKHLCLMIHFNLTL